DSCGGFCDWKAWCGHWLRWRHDAKLLDDGDFRDAVVRVVARPAGSSTVEVERLLPGDGPGEVVDGGGRCSMLFVGSALTKLEALMDEDAAAPIFVGSALAKGQQWRVGDWCDVLPWSPHAV
ncbi:MAG: hypothetical protein VXW74_01860, partial [Candidatus Thermoplasmatota archaeon]|nr:hypothetical protein [Candidatus Thermoplasmatota archaeon]